MQPMTANVNQRAGRSESQTMAMSGDSLIEDANGKERNDNAKDGHVHIVNPQRFQCNLERSKSLLRLCVAFRFNVSQAEFESLSAGGWYCCDGHLSWNSRRHRRAYPSASPAHIDADFVSWLWRDDRLRR
jgi:hypothetical protein